MILLIHISLALLSVAVATLALVAPSLRKMHLSYGLTVGTLVSGTWLALSMHAPLVSACMSGLIYLGFVAAMLMSANKRLHKSE